MTSTYVFFAFQVLRLQTHGNAAETYYQASCNATYPGLMYHPSLIQHTGLMRHNRSSKHNSTFIY